MTNRSAPGSGWRAWGDHPIVVAIVVIGTIVGIVAAWPAISSLFNKPPREVLYTGRVFNTQNQRPVEGAKVFLELNGVPPVVYTDSEGTFYFPVRSNTATIEGLIRVDAEKYKVYSRRVVIYLDRPEIIDVRLEPLSEAEQTSTLNDTPPVATLTESPSIPPTVTPVPATPTTEPTDTATPEPPPTRTPAPTPKPTLPPPSPTVDTSNLFSDNFQNGSNPNWIIERGSWTMVDQRFAVTQFDAGIAEVRIGDENWQNYSASLAAGGFYHDWGSGNDEVLRVAIRAQDADNYVWFDISSFRIKYGTRINGAEQEIGTKTSGVNGPVIGREVAIRVKAQGNTYELYINDTQFVVFEDASRPSGGVRLIARTGATGKMWIDSVKVNSIQ